MTQTHSGAAAPDLKLCARGCVSTTRLSDLPHEKNSARGEHRSLNLGQLRYAETDIGLSLGAVSSPSVQHDLDSDGRLGYRRLDVQRGIRLADDKPQT